MVPIEENVARVLDEIARAERESGRTPGSVRLCAATKLNTPESIQRAIAAGVHICGENRVQELTAKRPLGAYEGAELHFIGHLQKNKAKELVGVAALIQSCDSLELLEKINSLALARGVRQNVLLEVNIGGEAAKSGFAPEALEENLEKAAHLEAISIRGLMAIPPRAEQPGENRRFFAKMQQLFVDIGAKKYDNANMEVLSIGMSGDFVDAIAFGSNLVRVGTAIFGPRPAPEPSATTR